MSTKREQIIQLVKEYYRKEFESKRKIRIEMVTGNKIRFLNIDILALTQINFCMS